MNSTSNDTSRATIVDDYPPGHPAGTDDVISAEEVTSGHGLGTAGLLGTRVRQTDEPTHSIDAPAQVAVATGPIVLIAVEAAAASERVVQTAHRLFGASATYLAINVGPGPYTQMSWAYVWPVGAATPWYPSAWMDDLVESAVDSGTARAEAAAASVTHEAGLEQVTPIGDVGEPVSAIIRAAHHHHADVVVVGADARGWFSRLLDGSVERDLLREADFAVLVVDLAGVTPAG